MLFLKDDHGCAGWSGEMAGRIRAFNWSSTDLGPLDSWSVALCSAVQFMLASPVPLVMLWGRPGYMIYNDAYSVFAGGRHPYLLGTPVELGWPEVADFNRHVVDTCLAGETLTFNSKELVLLRAGQPENVWMDLYYSPVPGDDGAPAGVMAIVIETTEHVISERRRQEAEGAYRAANERVQLALNAGSLLGSFVWDIKTDTLSADERFGRTFSYPSESRLDRLTLESALHIIHPDDRAYVNAQIALTVEHGRPYNAEYRICRPDGQYQWILVSGRCEYDEQGVPSRFPGVLIDIHERKIAEESLRQLTRTLEQRVNDEVAARSAAEAKLRQAQKLEAIGGLTGGVAHDFNNLLQVIGGNLYLLAHQEPDNPRVQKRVSAATAAVARGARLTSQLLAFARRQALSPRVYSLPRIHDGLSELLQRALGETIRVRIDLPDDAWRIHVDPNQLENALLNLAINARDAMNGEGAIHIGAENRVLEGQACLDRELSPGEYVVLTVADSGCGMDPETLGHAVEPFFTTKPDGHGTGLGLSMVFGFVKQSGGYLEITSALGVGTRVALYFPRSLSPEALDLPNKVAALEGGHETILVVEDDDAVRTTSVALLQQAGYETLMAANGDDAMAILRSGAEVDLIFTDVVMPGHTKSADLALWAEQQTPKIPVLFTSGHTRDVLSQNRELTAGTLLLPKPYGPEAMVSMLKTALGRAAQQNAARETAAF